jgi:hypothetical protein
MIYKFSPLDLEKMYEVIRSVPPDRYIAAYMSQVTGEFYMDSSTKSVLDEGKVEYDLIEEIEDTRISFFYASPSHIGCVPYEENIKCFVLAHSPDAIGAVCIGVNCEKEFAQDLMVNGWQYFQWQVPQSHDKYLWRIFFTKDEAAEFLGHFFHGFEAARRWVEQLPGEFASSSAPVTLNLRMRYPKKTR